MAKDKKSFILYCDYLHTFSKLPDEFAGKLIKHVLEYVNDKYDDVTALHHYEITQSAGNTTTKIEVYANSALYSGDNNFYGTATEITNLEYEEELQDQRRKIKLLDPAYLPQFVKEFESLMGESTI